MRYGFTVSFVYHRPIMKDGEVLDSWWDSYLLGRHACVTNTSQCTGPNILLASYTQLSFGGNCCPGQGSCEVFSYMVPGTKRSPPQLKAACSLQVVCFETSMSSQGVWIPPAMENLLILKISLYNWSDPSDLCTDEYSNMNEEDQLHKWKSLWTHLIDLIQLEAAGEKISCHFGLVCKGRRVKDAVSWLKKYQMCDDHVEKVCNKCTLYIT